MKTIAFAVPILPGKTEQWKSFADEIVGAKRAAFEHSQKELGLTAENWYLQRTPQGDMAIKAKPRLEELVRQDLDEAASVTEAVAQMEEIINDLEEPAGEEAAAA